METEKKEYPVWKLILQIILALMLAFGLFLGVPLLVAMLWAANLDAKHEQMKPQVQELATAYIAEQYPGNDFEITALYHVFKDNSFEVKVRSRSSADTHFIVKFNDTTLEVDWDSYEDAVTNRGNTAKRIKADYEDRVKGVLKVLTGVQSVYTDYVICSGTPGYSLYDSPEGLDNRTLELDREYDTAAMGWDYGYLEVEFLESPEDLSIQRILERLWELDEAMTTAGVGYQVVKITLVSDPDWRVAEKFYIFDIRREDLYSEDPMAALQELWEEQEANRQARKEKWEKSE